MEQNGGKEKPPLLHVKIVHNSFCTILPPGEAQGCNLIRDHGRLDIFAEVTVWPKQLHYYLTTGEPCREALPSGDKSEDFVIAKLDEPEWAAEFRRTLVLEIAELEGQARKILNWLQGIPNEIDEKEYNPEEAKYHAEYNRARYDKLVAEHRCTRCKKKHRGKFKLCNKCRPVVNEQAKRYAIRRGQGGPKKL